jgi:acyl-coenzyme A synthetase/AMP-(fatty) acid ligase/thioesterase domain-containing protein/acyl carrier protein
LPDRLAFVSDTSSYTFSEADALSRHVADEITDRWPDDGAPIGLLAGHDADALVGMLGIWKAERIAVVLDTHLPEERLRDIVELAGLRRVIADDERRSLAEALMVDGGTTLLLRSAFSSTRSAHEQPEPSTIRQGQDAAAIVFTSGSTGRPKGVLQAHGQLLNDAYANGAQYRITPEDRVALVFPFGFAAGLSLLCVAVLNGACVYAYDPRDHGIRRFAAWLREHRISTLHCTPHLMRSLIETLEPDEVLETLRLVCTAGEAIYGRDVVQLRAHLNEDASFINWLGSSEMGTLSLFEIRSDDEVPTGPLPVGPPIANKEVRIVRDDGTDAEDGEVGDVVAISRYLSGGYWHNDEANALRFSQLPDGRRTCQQGDLGKIDSDGNLILLGRSGSAVKVRGYLVEPSEVEAALLRIEDVKDAVVEAVSNPPSPTRLVAYVVCDEHRRAPSAAMLRRELRTKLPEYMVPPTIVQLTDLPRTERGKVDRRNLPAPVAVRHSEPPSSQYELVVADIWCDVLGLDEIGLDDDFMESGGDSLGVEEVLVLVQERLGVILPSSDVIAAPTLREFTRLVQLGRESRLPSQPDVVTLHATGEKTPIHCFAGAGALALTFHPVSRHLPDRRIYGYQAHGLERHGLPDRTVRAAARRYLETLRVLQPSGPYILLGHSFGGLVALEIADMLTSAGEEVEFVGLLDTYLPSSVATADYDYVRLPEREHGAGQLTRALNSVGKWFDNLLPEGIPAVNEWGRHARSYVAGVVQFDGQKQFDAFFDQLKRVARHHRMHRYEGRSLLVLADNNPDGQDAWRPYLADTCDIVHIASEHSSLLREPHASELAAVLQTHLEGQAETAQSIQAGGSLKAAG